MPAKFFEALAAALHQFERLIDGQRVVKRAGCEAVRVILETIGGRLGDGDEPAAVGKCSANVTLGLLRRTKRVGVDKLAGTCRKARLISKTKPIKVFAGGGIPSLIRELNA